MRNINYYWLEAFKIIKYDVCEFLNALDHLCTYQETIFTADHVYSVGRTPQIMKSDFSGKKIILLIKIFLMSSFCMISTSNISLACKNYIRLIL